MGKCASRKRVPETVPEDETKAEQYEETEAEQKNIQEMEKNMQEMHEETEAAQYAAEEAAEHDGYTQVAGESQALRTQVEFLGFSTNIVEFPRRLYRPKCRISREPREIKETLEKIKESLEEIKSGKRAVVQANPQDSEDS